MTTWPIDLSARYWVAAVRYYNTSTHVPVCDAGFEAKPDWHINYAAALQLPPISVRELPHVPPIRKEFASYQDCFDWEALRQYEEGIRAEREDHEQQAIAYARSIVGSDVLKMEAGDSPKNEREISLPRLTENDLKPQCDYWAGPGREQIARLVAGQEYRRLEAGAEHRRIMAIAACVTSIEPVVVAG